MLKILYILLLIVTYNQTCLSQEIIDFEHYTWKFDGTEGFKVVVRIDTANIKDYSIDLSLKNEHSNYAVLNIECKNKDEIGDFTQLNENATCTISRKPLEPFPQFVDIEFWFHAVNHSYPNEPGLELHRWDIDVTDKSKYYVSFDTYDIKPSYEEDLWISSVLEEAYGYEVIDYEYKYDSEGNYGHKNFVLTFNVQYDDTAIQKVLEKFPNANLIIKFEPPAPPLPLDNKSKWAEEWQNETDRRAGAINLIEELKYLEFIQIEDNNRFICVRFYKDTPNDIKQQHEQFVTDICNLYKIELMIRPGVTYTEKLICSLETEFDKIEEIVKYSITNNNLFHFSSEAGYSTVRETDKKQRIRSKLNEIFNKYNIEPEYSLW